MSEPRHPMDLRYRCGFDPLGKKYAECVGHWEGCPTAECQGFFAFHRSWIRARRRRLAEGETVALAHSAGARR